MAGSRDAQDGHRDLQKMGHPGNRDEPIPSQRLIRNQIPSQPAAEVHRVRVECLHAPHVGGHQADGSVEDVAI
jgi:hypothetical protein